MSGGGSDHGFAANCVYSLLLPRLFTLKEELSEDETKDQHDYARC